MPSGSWPGKPLRPAYCRRAMEHLQHVLDMFHRLAQWTSASTAPLNATSRSSQTAIDPSVRSCPGSADSPPLGLPACQRAV
jgi:hypothetical protein